jgi:DNA-damage-inducible protein J
MGKCAICVLVEVSVDPFYSENNIHHLEQIMLDVKSGKAHFSEHDLVEVDKCDS